MDSISVLGLASSIIQLISFASDLVSKSREIYKSADGELTEHLELETIAKSLQDLSTDLPAQLKQKESMTKTEKQLRDLYEDCNVVSIELINAIRELKAGGNHKKWNSFRQALNTVWKESEIDTLSKRLEKYRSQLDTTLLVSLREQIQTDGRGSSRPRESAHHQLYAKTQQAKPSVSNTYAATTFGQTEEYEWQNCTVDWDLVSCDSGMDLGMDRPAIESLYHLSYFDSICKDDSSINLPQTSSMYATAGSDCSTRAYSIDEVVRDFWVLSKKHWTDFELHGDPFPAPSCGLCVLGNLQASSREDCPGGHPIPSTLDRCQKHHKHRNNVWGSCRSTRTLISRSSESFEGTGRWFLDHEHYNQWLTQPSSFLWLCGRPGAGKSVLMSTVIRDLEKTLRAGELVVYYFANGYYRGVSTAKAILCSMLGQLLFRKPFRNSFAEVLPLLNDVIAAGTSLSVTSIAWLFSKIRHKLRSHETLYLLLDGLDEVTDSPSERELVLELIDQASRHDPNHQIKCFISSRSTFFGARLPKGALRVDLDSHPQTRNDMSLYVQDSLHKLVFSYPSRDIKDLEERVLNSASGSFLLLRLILQQAGPGGANSRGDFKDFLIRLSDFSEIELGGIYGGMLAGIVNSDKEAAVSMLRWVTFAARPLELHELLALYKQTGVEIKEEDISTISAGLLINSGNQIRFAHLSVREYFESHLSERWEALSDEANEMIAHTCLKLIPTQDLLQSLGLTSEKRASTESTTTLDFVPYARIHWMFHYKRAERRSTYLAGLLHDTLENSLKISRTHGLGLGMENSTKSTFEGFSGAENIQLNIEQHNSEPPSIVNIALAVSAEFGFSKLAGLELDMGADPNILSGPEQQTPLCLAAKWGHLEVVKLLLHRGADPSMASWSGLTPVAYAMANGHYEIRQFLVSHPAKGLWRSNTYEEWSGDQNATQAMLLTASLSPSCTCSDYWVNYELRAVPEICENTGKSLPPIMVSGETISESELQLSLNSMSLENSRSVSIVVRWYPGVPMYRVLKSVSKRGIDDVRKLLLAVGNDKDKLDMVISVSKLLAKSSL